jgi:hypothetical protein
VSIVALAAAACAPSGGQLESDGTWVGTITAEGNVTTVVNESGSVWGGSATLLGEASIGVDSGPDEYMFGEITGIHVSERFIYVVDQQVPRVRQYTLDGQHVRDLGRQGQGPGEYETPGAITGDGTGRIFVQEDGARRINVYSEAGEVLDSWPAPEFVCCKDPIVPQRDGNVLVVVWNGQRNAVLPYGVQAHGPGGPFGAIREPEPIPFEPATIGVEFGTEVVNAPVPFSPYHLFALAPSGAIVLATSDRYRFEVRQPDGRRTIVERSYTPTPVVTEEADWQRKRFIALMSEYGGELAWDGTGMPGYKPAMFELAPQPDDSTWVVRQGPSERVDACIEDPIAAGSEAADDAPCWRDSWIFDAFDEQGRYLGEIDGLDRVASARSTIVSIGDMVVAPVEDEMGTIMVKRYRLELPSNRE